jgi:hypothetical protein
VAQPPTDLPPTHVTQLNLPTVETSNNCAV